MAVTLSSGTTVRVVSGKYEGRSATVDRLTAVKVWILFEDGSKACIPQSSVVDPTYRNLDEEQKEEMHHDIHFAEHVQSAESIPAEEPPLGSCKSSNQQQLRLRFCKGKYLGQTGTMESATKKMVYVTLDQTGLQIRVNKDCVVPETGDSIDMDSLPPRDATPRSSGLKDDNSGRTRSGTPYQTRSSGILEIAGFPVDSIALRLPSQTQKVNTFAALLFRDRLLTINIPVQASSNDEDVRPPPSFSHNSRDYELIFSKVHREKTTFGSKYRCELQYVAVSDGNRADDVAIDLQQELDKIGNFSGLALNKAASRLELFGTPAAKSNLAEREYLIFHLSSDDFEIIEENCHEGCAFASRSFMEHVAGTNKVGQRTMALQVRMFIPGLGIFKGIIMEKPGITKIQVPGSLSKVGPSLVPPDADWACILVKGTFPSATNIQIAKVLDPMQEPSLKSLKPLTEMITRLWRALEVPESLIRDYTAKAKEPNNAKHSFLLGVADPTGTIPEGHIFVPGMNQQSSLFVTRCPCMKPDDGYVLPVVIERSRSMSLATWDWLNNLHFGCIIFGNSRSGYAPLPSLIANGDLDGDLYFICWDSLILANLNCKALEVPRLKPKSAPTVQVNRNWLKETQSRMCNLVQNVHLHQLMGVFHTASEKAAHSSVDGPKDADAIQLGEAYKAAIDLPKHGGKIKLSAHLWCHVPLKFHKHLDEE